MKRILQIPVEGGHEGGQIKVEFNDEIRLFSVWDGSDVYYHVTLMYSDCDHTFEEVTFGWRLAMVYDLELESNHFPYPLSSPTNLYTFVAEKNLQHFMARWNPVRNNHPNQLFLLLEHRYPPSELSFCHLKGRDRLLVQFLLSADSINMYLTHLRKSKSESPLEFLSEEEDDEITDDEDSDCMIGDCFCCMEKRCKCLRLKRKRDNFDLNTPIRVEYLSLTCLDNRIVECPRINVDIDKEMIRFNRNLSTLDTDETLVESDFLQKEDDHFDPNTLRYVFNTRTVLVLSKKNSLSFELFCNFTFALDRLEANPDIRGLNEVITFCEMNPVRVWVGAIDREERTRRLLSMCIQLRAVSEGLKLLKLLSDIFPGEPIQYEGLRNKAIAIEAANLANMIGFSATICEYINKLFSEQRAREQFENLVHLVMRLHELELMANMAEFRKTLGERCVNFLCIPHPNNIARELPVSALVTGTAMVFRLYQQNSVMLNLKSLGLALKSLDQRKLFFVIKGIATTCRSYLDSKHEFQKVLQELHRKLLNAFIPKDVAVEVMLFYLQLGDAILLKKLTQELTYTGNMRAIEMIVASPDVWNKSLVTLGGKWALNLLVCARIQFLSKTQMPVFSWIQETALFDHEPALNKFFRSSAMRETFTGFASREHAKTWCDELCVPDQVSFGYSAKFDIKCGGPIFECVITKTRDLYQHNLKLFHQSRAELLALQERKRRRLPSEECSSKVSVIKTSLIYSSSSGTSSCVSPPVPKRMRNKDVERK